MHRLHCLELACLLTDGPNPDERDYEHLSDAEWPGRDAESLASHQKRKKTGSASFLSGDNAFNLSQSMIDRALIFRFLD